MLAAAAAAAAANHHARKVAVKVLVNNNGQPTMPDLSKAYTGVAINKSVNPALFAPTLLDGSPILKHFAGVYGVDFTKNPEYKALLQESYNQAVLQSIYGQHLGMNYSNLPLPYMYYGHPTFGMSLPSDMERSADSRVENGKEKSAGDAAVTIETNEVGEKRKPRLEPNENSNSSMASNIEIEN